jgi:ketosteroid isomerase-like protein
MAEHPFREVWRTRDLAVWADSLAPDVVLHSPVISETFRGKDAAVELYGTLLETLGAMEITEELAGDGAHAFFWRADAGGRWIEGADFIRHNADGRIAEVRVLIRPLVGIAAFAGATGPAVAAKRGRARALVLRILTAPLSIMLAVADAVASRLVVRR